VTRTDRPSPNKGLGATGLFRESGSQANMKKIKEHLDKGALVTNKCTLLGLH
jgi:hypothetical protein